MTTDTDTPQRDPLAAFEANGYIAELASDVAALGRLAACADQVSGRVAGTYLKVLVGTAQARRKWADLATVKLVHSELYAHVVIGATTPDVAPDSTDSAAERRRKTLERNRRTNFARTAAHTLIAWIRAGGHPEDLDPAKVTKSSLAEATRQRLAELAGAIASPPGIGITVDLEDAKHAAYRAYHRFLRAMRQLKVVSPESAKYAGETFCGAVAQEFVNP